MAQQPEDDDEDMQLFPFAPFCRLDERYVLIRKIGEGISSTVWQAQDLSYEHARNEMVALKICRPNPQYCHNAVHEARMMAMMLSDVGTLSLLRVFALKHSDKGSVVIVTELHKGTLRELQQNVFPEGVPVQIARKMMRQILKGVQALHKNGIVHCDLKPDNIFISDVEQKDFIRYKKMDICNFSQLPIGKYEPSNKSFASGAFVNSPKFSEVYTVTHALYRRS